MSALRDRRLALGLSLRDVERATKGRVSNAYISQIETGKIRNPSFGAVCELAAVYALPVDEMRELLGLTVLAAPPILCPTCGQALKGSRP